MALAVAIIITYLIFALLFASAIWDGVFETLPVALYGKHAPYPLKFKTFTPFGKILFGILWGPALILSVLLVFFMLFRIIGDLFKGN